RRSHCCRKAGGQADLSEISSVDHRLLPFLEWSKPFKMSLARCGEEFSIGKLAAVPLQLATEVRPLSFARPPDLPIELGNLVEMRAHAGISESRIVGLDRLEDRDVRIEGGAVLAGIAERHASLLDQPIDDGPVHDHIDGIPGDGGDGVVKCDIRALKASDITDGLV